MSTDKVVGIDLGTTNSCACVIEGTQPVIIPSAEGTRTTPSVVSFTRSGERLVGLSAKRQAVTNPDKTIQSAKRHIGTDHRFKVHDNSFSPEQISAMVLQKIKADCEAYLGEEVTRAVITVPAYFNDAQRQSTRDAGQIAGLEVLRIINEPTASALAYGLNKPDVPSNILVFDLGGGTFDVSVLLITEGVFEVKATSGNNALGGDDFDDCLMNWLQKEFKEESGIDISNDLVARSRLKEVSERAKIELSSMLSTDINLPFLAADATGPKHLERAITRADFDKLTQHLVESTMEPVRVALADAKLKPDQIDQILLVGGAARIPAVQEAIRRMFGKEPTKNINPDEAVAIGAAVQASVLSGAGEVQDLLLLDVIPLSLGLETNGELFTKIINRNTTIPTSRTMTFTTSSDGQTSVQLHILQGERELAKFNQSLAKFTLEDIPRAPRGIPQIHVTFEVDADGILHCSASNAALGIEQRVTVKRSAGLTPGEVEKLAAEASAYAQTDAKQKELITAKIKAESLITEAQRTLERYGGLVDKTVASDAERALKALKESLESNDDSLSLKVAELDKALLSLGKALHTRTDTHAGHNPKQAASGPETSPSSLLG
ncbi:MAG: molecular chaperone DnaK, partial [Candidatus Obscuribacterales bacterium]|nr:molecular chaperone DnaK [Candidatus Obscuribacterales bacterium]